MSLWVIRILFLCLSTICGYAVSQLQPELIENKGAGVLIGFGLGGLLIAIDETDPRPIYQQIVDEVRRALVLGSLGEEDPLPSVRQLAADLRVNPNTVQQAYRELEREGLVYVRRGLGTYVAEIRGGGTARERRTLAALQSDHGVDLRKDFAAPLWRVRLRDRWADFARAVLEVGLRSQRSGTSATGLRARR